MSGFRHYNAFLRAAKREGLTHREAQHTYRAMRDRMGRSPIGADVKRHPRIFRSEAKTEIKKQRSEKPRGEKPPVERARRIRTNRDWYDMYLDELADFEQDTIEAGVDTGRSKKK